MRRRTCLLVLAFLLAGASTALAQERPQIGFGMGLRNFTFTEALFDATGVLPQLYVPIRATSKLMIEPGIGFIRMSEGEESMSLLSVGAGILFAASSFPEGDIYIGPRVGILRTSFDSGAGDDSQTHLSIAGVAGGEFFLAPQFSLGGEVGLSYFKYDDGDSEFEQDRDQISTVTEFRVRWYFR